MEEKTKLCPACNLAKPVSEFGKDKSKGDGLSYKCKPCIAKRKSERYKDSDVRAKVKNRPSSQKRWADHIMRELDPRDC